MLRIAAMHGELSCITGENLFLGMGVFQRIAAMGGEGVILRPRKVLAIFVIADDVGVDLVDGYAIGVIDEVGGVAARGAHIAFEGDEIAFFA